MSQLLTNLRVHLSFSLFFLVWGGGGGVGGKKGWGALGTKLDTSYYVFRL